MSYKETPTPNQITETINGLLEIQGVDLTEVFNHNNLSNFLIECRDEILMKDAQLLIRRDKIEKLKSGPGGIMEMKQTIADKEQRIEKLESRFFMVNQFKLYFHAFNKAADRIEKLEAALREMLIRCTNTGRWCGPIDCHCRIARKALGGKND